MIPESANGLSGFSSRFQSQIDANSDGLGCDGFVDFDVSTSYSLSTDPGRIAEKCQITERKSRISNAGIADRRDEFDAKPRVFFECKMRKLSARVFVVQVMVVVGMSSIAYGQPKLNTQRVKHEPGWSGPSVLQGDAKTANQDIPILERDYRPLHVYGNMSRRHHYRGTVIPSHRDRVEMFQAIVTKQPVEEKYVKNRYR